MRKVILYPSLLFIVFLTATSSQAQTLNTGDIAFTGINSSGTADDFSFVVLRPGGIANGTIIRFTDKGWQSGTGTGLCQTPTWGTQPEGEIQWQANTQIKYGTQVRVSNNPLSSSHGTVTAIGAALTITQGDQIFAYQGTFTTPTVMIAGIHMNIEAGGTTTATNWDNVASVVNSANSNRPQCLTNGTFAFYFAGSPNDRTNARLRSITFTGNRATDLANVNNVANWDSNNGTTAGDVFVLPNQTMSGLPVDFTSIRASQKSGNVEVEWNVGTEDGLSRYAIERSSDGRLFADLGTVAATGKRSYAFSDIKPMDGVNYYRIRAVDIDESVKYSTIAIVNLGKGTSGIKVYPTVVRSNQFNLQITNLPAGSYKLNLHSATGQVVFTRTINHTGGSATQSINMQSSLPRGLYRLNMFTGDHNVVTNIVVE